MYAKGPRKAPASRGPLRLPLLRRLAFGVALAGSTLAAMTAVTAHAQPSHAQSPLAGATASDPPATCVIHSLPSFVAQGENTGQVNTEATVADVIQVGCNPNVYGTGSKITITASQLFTRCQGKVTWYVPNPFAEVPNARGVTVRLDADGNAIVALRAGPECSAGEVLVTAHMNEEPFESVTTSYSVLPPVTTPPGVFALPATEVEDASSSGVATIIETEFAGGSEKFVHIASEELFHRCQIAPHLRWVRMSGAREDGVAELGGVQLDNDGNGFVIALGDASCAEGPSLIEADLLSKPFTTFSTFFNIEAPRPTGEPPPPPEEPSFTIEKRQQIIGSAAGFTTAPLTASVGQGVGYQVTVANTGNQALVFSGFTDARCDSGTITGGPGGTPVAPGGAATYTCTRALAAAGSYVNEASVTGTTPDGSPLSETSNRVEVAVSEPAPSNQPQATPGAGPASTSGIPRKGELGFCQARQPVLHGASGPKRGPFTLKVISKGIKQITFYLDGRKLKTLRQSQAKGGKFAFKIDPRTLSFGAHKVSIKVLMNGANCASIARSGVFVHPAAQQVAPIFAG
jgi:hypothetical protein